MENKKIEPFEENTSQYKVTYVLHIGSNAEGLHIYHFLLSENAEEVFSEGWEEKPAGNIPNDTLMIEEEMYEHIMELRTEIVLDLAQDNTCFSMQDCRDGIVALAYENIDEYEEYPEGGRIVIRYGECINEIEEKLAARQILMRYIR